MFILALGCWGSSWCWCGRGQRTGQQDCGSAGRRALRAGALQHQGPGRPGSGPLEGALWAPPSVLLSARTARRAFISSQPRAGNGFNSDGRAVRDERERTPFVKEWQSLLSVITSDARSCIAGGIPGSSKRGAAGWGENIALQISWVHLLSRSKRERFRKKTKTTAAYSGSPEMDKKPCRR